MLKSVARVWNPTEIHVVRYDDAGITTDFETFMQAKSLG